MKNIKILLFCQKPQPYLHTCKNGKYNTEYDTPKGYAIQETIWGCKTLNNKFVGECDIKIEELMCDNYEDARDGYIQYFHALSNDNFEEGEKELLEKGCLDFNQLNNYLKEENGYALHIKNLHIFDEPKNISNYYHLNEPDKKLKALYRRIGFLCEHNYNRSSQILHYHKRIYVSLHPEELRRILNGEQTIIVIKTLLKEMIAAC